LDKLKVKYFLHYDALAIARNFFLEHDYTHLLIYAEDVITTPDVVKLLIKDAEEYDFPIVSGWINFDFKRNWLSFTFKDLSNIYVKTHEQYEFPTTDYVLKHDLKNPFIETFFQGFGLTLIRRDVVEKIPFKPYKIQEITIANRRFVTGIMFDLQYAIELKKMGIKNIIDLRCFAIHFGYTTPLAKSELIGKGIVEFIPKKSDNS